MVVADLHVHTTNSDGSLTIETLPAAARDSGVEVVAVTDHDRLHPGLDEPVTEQNGVTVVHGIELRVESPAGRIDLLGYGVTPTDDLVAELDRLQTDRIERGRAIAECVEDRLGVDLDLTFEAGIGRPHVARAVDESPTDYDYEETFEELIGDGGPCFVAREIPDFERGRELLAEACSLVVLAHPFRYDDPEAALALTEWLDGVERYYPYEGLVEFAPLEDAVESHDLLVTGGSDAHDDQLGRAGLDAAAWRAVRDRLGI